MAGTPLSPARSYPDRSTTGLQGCIEKSPKMESEGSRRDRPVGPPRPTGRRCLLDPLDVLARPRVDPDLLAGADEGGYGDLEAGLQGRFLVLIRGGGPLDRRGCVDDGQVD